MRDRTEQRKDYYQRNKEKIKEKSKQYYYDHRIESLKAVMMNRIKNLDSEEYRVTILIRSARRRAKDNSIKFDIDLDYLLDIWKTQNLKCAVSGLSFEFNNTEHRVNKNSPSLDRIDSSKGYIKGNVRFVTWHVNCALSEYGYETFLALCEAVIENKEINYGPQTS